MIQGLTYIPDAIDRSFSHKLIQQIDNASWRTDLKRRIQHYGYVYDYKRRTIDKDMYLGELPHWANGLVELLAYNKNFGIRPDQMIVNEYEPGQGITHHIDCEPCFDDMIASVSLNSTCVMSFIHPENNRKHEIMLEPNSLLILRNEARYEWKHGIAGRKTDKYNGRTYARGRRLSVTFRKVILRS